MLKKYDIVIIGGGPVGLSFARSLCDSDLNVLLVERSNEQSLITPAVDGRDIALTHLSMEILKEMHVLSKFPEDSISSIRAAKVLNGDSSYSLNIDSEKEAVEALGYIVPNNVIRQAVYESVIEQDKIDILYETSVDQIVETKGCSQISLSNGDKIEASLVVAADSRFSESRRKQGISASMLDFGRVVIVCRMESEKSHQDIAHECFLYGRTLAVLPLTENLNSIVVTVSADQATELLAMSEEAFTKKVQSWFESRHGEMKLVGERYSYPLVAVHANKFVKSRYALIGDAAVGMHPVTAHGFNLGLRGQNTLFKEIVAAHKANRDIGALSVLKPYETQHMRVTKPLYHGTNEIVGLFTNDSTPAKMIRNAVLRFSNNFPPIKKLIANKLTESEHSKGLTLPTFLH